MKLDDGFLMMWLCWVPIAILVLSTVHTGWWALSLVVWLVVSFRLIIVRGGGRP